MTEKEKIVVKQIQRLEKRRDKLTIEINKQMALLELICTHSDVIEDEVYIEGDCYDKSEYIEGKRCITCNKFWQHKKEKIL